MVRLYTVLTVTQPQNIIPVAAFFHNSSFSPLHIVKECNGNNCGPAFATEQELQIRQQLQAVFKSSSTRVEAN